MVVSLGPGRFYGSSLPRPRVYTDVKLNDERVDPPLPVTDPLMSWAEEAHWSMGGLSFQRLRLQGRIEGNVDRLRRFKEKQAKLQEASSSSSRSSPSPKVVREKGVVEGRKVGDRRKRAESLSPLPSSPPPPVVSKRRRFMDLFDEESESESEEEVEKRVKGGGGVKKMPVRKLVGEFEKVAKENEVNAKNGGDVLGEKTGRSSGVGDAVMQVLKELNLENIERKKLKGGTGKRGKSAAAVNGLRTSPRLARQRPS